jgi:hypothetical protein
MDGVTCGGQQFVFLGKFYVLNHCTKIQYVWIIIYIIRGGHTTNDIGCNLNWIEFNYIQL